MAADPSAAKERADRIAESAWQLNQRLAHADYLGTEPDPFQLRLDLADLALLVYEFALGEVEEPPRRCARCIADAALASDEENYGR